MPPDTKTPKITPTLRTVVRHIHRAAKERGLSVDEYLKEATAWMELFKPLAEKHELRIDIVVSVYGVVKDGYRNIIDQTPNWQTDLRRKLDKVADRHGIPNQDMMPLVKDLNEMIHEGRDALPKDA
jgi:hypothetical protein